MSTIGRVPLQLPLLPASDFCQRWRQQRVVWRHRHAAGETFVPRGYEVAPIGRPETADFLRDHHYLHKLPANRFRFGLLRGADLVGIAVLGPGMPHTLGALFPDLEPSESLVLDRFALLDDVKALGETWFLARVFALLRSGGIEAVATFSDPWPRRDRHGRSVHVGHIGTVFQAASAIYTGLTARETFHQLHDTGELVHRRALSKFRNGERSSRYLETVLLGVGAPPRSPSETPVAWLDRVLPLVSSPYVHGGNHRYAFLIGRHRRHLRVATPARPYPKQRTPSVAPLESPARMDYRVTWEIDIEEVDSALAAALEAHRIMLDPASIATVFTVTSSAGTTELVDLLPEDAGGLSHGDG